VQTEGGYMRDFVAEVDHALRQLHLLYVDEDDSWAGSEFFLWNSWQGCLCKTKSKRDSSPWVFSEGPDIDGTEFDAPVLCRRVARDTNRLIPLTAKYMPTPQCPCPLRLPQYVDEEQAVLLVSDTREQVTAAVQSLITDLEDRFPMRELLCAFDIITPNVWSANDSSEPDELHDMLQCLISAFGVDNCKTAADGTVVHRPLPGLEI
jgi:hypothetical protein